MSWTTQIRAKRSPFSLISAKSGKECPMNVAPFDTPYTLRFNEARKALMGRLLQEIINGERVSNALDVGCGFGYFSQYLKQSGIEVMGIDGRPENVEEARKRYPDIDFKVYDIEELSVGSLGQYDLVLCFGLLYHLENPFRAIRNLSSLT